MVPINSISKECLPTFGLNFGINILLIIDIYRLHLLWFMNQIITGEHQIVGASFHFNYHPQEER